MTEKQYKLFSPPLRHDVFQKRFGSDLGQLLANNDVKRALNKANSDYLHWEELKYKDWIPEKIFPEKELFWTLLKISRVFSSIPTPIRDSTKHFFRMNISHYNEFLHSIDKEMAGNFMGISDFSENDKKQFIARNIIEESIASSQLEGANTSRAVAKKMLLEGRKPLNNSEKMIVNNHKAMLRIEQSLYKEKISWKLICELHSMITENTLEPEKQGKIRDTLDEHGNRLVIKPWDDTIIAYIAPDKEFVQAEIPRLVAFANDEESNEHGFIHPLIKGIMLHFWIGLLHPFEDGNGRLARILFYWYMLRHEYWAFAYLSLSEKIKKSSKQYAMAYIYSEQDDWDLTYFIHYNIEKIKLSEKEFQKYIKTKIDENKLIIALSQKDHALNERQIKLLQFFNQKMESRTNISAHQKIYAVKKITAITDLKELITKGFLTKKKQGRNVYYYPTRKIFELFKFRD